MFIRQSKVCGWFWKKRGAWQHDLLINSIFVFFDICCNNYRFGFAVKILFLNGVFLGINVCQSVCGFKLQYWSLIISFTASFWQFARGNSASCILSSFSVHQNTGRTFWRQCIRFCGISTEGSFSKPKVCPHPSNMFLLVEKDCVL